MVKSVATYTGDLHCQIQHGPSQSVIETDAPIDNNGKGEKFSPTDLMAAAVGGCTLTVMSIVAERDGVNLKGAKAEVEKHMIANPRRIGKLITTISFPKGIPHDYRKKLENTAHTCPVHNSLREDIEAPLVFVYPD